MSCQTLKGKPKLTEKLLGDFCSIIKRHKLRLHSLTRQSWMGTQMNANLIAIDFLSTSQFESKGRARLRLYLQPFETSKTKVSQYFTLFTPV